MEPCGFVRSVRYGGLIQRRDANRLRKRHARAACPDRAAASADHRPMGLQEARATIRRWIDPHRRRRPVVALLCLIAPRSRRPAAPATEPIGIESVPPGRQRRRPAPPSRRSAPAPAATSTRRDLRRHRGAGRRDPRAAADGQGRPRDHRRGPAPRDRSPRSSTRTARPSYMAANERLYKALGLIPRTPTSRRCRSTCSAPGSPGSTQRPEEDVRRLAGAASSGAARQITYAHEYTHALQDQNYTVFTDQEEVLDQSDWLLARQAIYEGDATLLMSLLGDRQSHPGRSSLESRRPGRSGTRRRSWTGCRRSSGRACSTRTRPVPSTSRRRRCPAAGPPSMPSTTACPTSTEQILHPEEVRRERGAGRGDPAQGARQGPRSRLDRGARGYVRGAPDWASGSAKAACRRGRCRRLRRPAGAATGWP